MWIAEPSSLRPWGWIQIRGFVKKSGVGQILAVCSVLDSSVTPGDPAVSLLHRSGSSANQLLVASPSFSSHHRMRLKTRTFPITASRTELTAGYFHITKKEKNK
ncbi:hypothetical protein EYF80_036668 [Liparis tanakae]|uniref:Uncharacterized protein n=1 Tax=Liparis tanakae TaxID=230148 RepID=A0A4Z2GIE0_9TELE|nr:hypothetical protein EYF80_036668 [Liparis tanakae]